MNLVACFSKIINLCYFDLWCEKLDFLGKDRHFEVTNVEEEVLEKMGSKGRSEEEEETLEYSIAIILGIMSLFPSQEKK